MYISILTKHTINITDWQGKDLTQSSLESLSLAFSISVAPLPLACLVMGGGWL